MILDQNGEPLLNEPLEEPGLQYCFTLEGLEGVEQLQFQIISTDGGSFLIDNPTLHSTCTQGVQVANVMSTQDYYPFGMVMPGRNYQGAESYRYGFNGKEKDDEVKGAGNQHDYGFRIYDARVGRFFSIDPLFKTYPWYTPYQYAGNSPIAFIDLDGLERVLAITFNGEVNYRADFLELANEDEISRAVLTTDPGSQLAQAFIDASSADENGIGFVAIWGHGRAEAQWGDASNSYTMYQDDLDALRTAVANADVSFTDNAIIYVGNCNAGTCNASGESFAQEIADITGARVVAGEGSVGMSPTQQAEEKERMEYSMYNPNTQNFRLFQQGKVPIDLGGTMDVKNLLERGKQIPVIVEPKEIAPIPVETPELNIRK